jgi:hypothetical protein
MLDSVFAYIERCLGKMQIALIGCNHALVIVLVVPADAVNVRSQARLYTSDAR